MSMRGLTIGECRSYQVADARTGSAKLLAAMQAHHDANMVPPDRPAPIEAGAKPVSVPPQSPDPAPKSMWFSVVGIGEKTPRLYPSVQEIQVACAKHYGVTRHDIISARRTANVVRPRQVGMYLAKVLTPRSYPDIGRRFGGRDHTTALHAFRKIERLLETDGDLAEDVTIIKSRVGAQA